MRAAWFWIDRWRKSTAYSDMTLAEMGAYRNLLDELWLRDGLLPLNERVLGKIAGSESEWPTVRDAVMAHFIKTDAGWRNETHDEVQGNSEARAKQQQNYRDRAKSGWSIEIASQGGLCGCCNEPLQEPYSKYVVRDHDHRSGTHRALVCQSCNTCIGRIEGGRPLNNGKTTLVKLYLQRWLNVPSSPSPSPSPYSGTVSEEKISARQTSPHRNGSAVSDGFDVFWQAYPNKKGKDAARKAWTKRHFTSQQLAAIVASIQEQCEWPDWKKDEGRFVPHPATWLNAGRWMDEPQSSAPDKRRAAPKDFLCCHAERCEDFDTCNYTAWLCEHEPPCPSRTSCAMTRGLTR